jgi:hypothetical protein
MKIINIFFQYSLTQSIKNLTTFWMIEKLIAFDYNLFIYKIKNIFDKYFELYIIQ